MSASDQPFRFLDLPIELRFIVYDLLPCSSVHHTVTRALDDHPDDEWYEEVDTGDEYNWVTLITSGVPAQILATCSRIKEEAFPFLQRKLETLEALAPRIICNTEGLMMLMDPVDQGIFPPLLTWLEQYYMTSGQRACSRPVPLTWSSDPGVERWLRKTASLILHTVGPARWRPAREIHFRILIQVRDLASPSTDLNDPYISTFLVQRIVNGHLDHHSWNFTKILDHPDFITEKLKLETADESTTMVRFCALHFEAKTNCRSSENYLDEWEMESGWKEGEWYE